MTSILYITYKIISKNPYYIIWIETQDTNRLNLSLDANYFEKSYLLTLLVKKEEIIVWKNKFISSQDTLSWFKNPNI